MTILFLFQKFSFSSSTIYLDLVRALRDAGHRVLIAAGTSDQSLPDTEEREGIRTAYVRLPDQFHTDKIRKGLIQLTIGRKTLSVIRRYFWQEKVDLIAYPTPPITLAGILKPLKEHYGALTYLMLKDIFPQNAVDLKMMREKGILHRFFRRMEEQLYRESDRSGCMSQADIGYVKTHKPGIGAEKLELFPNTVKILPSAEETAFSGGDGDAGAGETVLSGETEGAGAGEKPVTFMFGGNMGKPQAVDFLLSCVEELRDCPDARFLFVGEGTETERILTFLTEKKPPNMIFAEWLPRAEYEKRLAETDVGLVVLSPDFTIPNYPSRILSYMQLSKPVLAATDRVTDVHALVTYEARCGWWCASDDVESFTETIRKICRERDKLPEYGRNGRRYLEEHFNVESSVRILEKAAAEGMTGRTASGT